MFSASDTVSFTLARDLVRRSALVVGTGLGASG
jgi:hypothetical protein